MYGTSLPFGDFLENFKPLEFCWTECTSQHTTLKMRDWRLSIAASLEIHAVWDVNAASVLDKFHTSSTSSNKHPKKSPPVLILKGKALRSFANGFIQRYSVTTQSPVHIEVRESSRFRRWHRQSFGNVRSIKSQKALRSHVISGLREVDENCALLGYYAASSGGNYHYSLNYHNSLRNRPEESRCLRYNFRLSNIPKICQAINNSKCNTFDLNLKHSHC